MQKITVNADVAETAEKNPKNTTYLYRNARRTTLNTSSIMRGVSLPVFVFGLLGW